MVLPVDQAAALRSALPHYLPASVVLGAARFLNPPRRKRLQNRRRAFSALCRRNHAALRFGALRFHQRPTFASGRRRDKEMRLCDVVGCRDYDPHGRWVMSSHSDPFEREFVACGNCSEELWSAVDAENLGRTIGPVRAYGPDVMAACVPADLRGRDMYDFCEIMPADLMSDDPDRFYIHGERALEVAERRAAPDAAGQLRLIQPGMVPPWI